MSSETVITLGQQAFIIMLMIAAPPLLTALTVGLIVGVFQAATQVNELTLSFIPKMIALVLVLIAAGPWILKIMSGYMQRLYSDIPYLIG